MFNVFADINWLAVIVAFLAVAALGGVYFGALVTRPYAISLGREHHSPTKPGPLQLAGPPICSLFAVLASAALIGALHITTLGDALLYGLIVGVGYLAAMTFNIAINPNFPRPILYGGVNAPYFVLSSLITSVLLALWR